MSRLASAAAQVVNRALRPMGARITRIHSAPASPPTSLVTDDFYYSSYEMHARALPPEVSIGGGDYDEMGINMLSALVHAGLRRDHCLLDFGCGTGRLARHAIPYLTEGQYIGLDISETMLAHAASAIESGASRRAEWIHHVNGPLPLGDSVVDLACAFSVFTHMEHEDTFRQLKELRRVITPDGALVCSVLTMDLLAARNVFLRSAESDLAVRWQTVRNVTTSYQMMESLADLSGWSVDSWYPGDQELIPKLGTNDRCAIGQTILVLRPVRN